eukprot:6397489-Amphidinium_carterae.1
MHRNSLEGCSHKSPPLAQDNLAMSSMLFLCVFCAKQPRWWKGHSAMQLGTYDLFGFMIGLNKSRRIAIRYRTDKPAMSQPSAQQRNRCCQTIRKDRSNTCIKYETWEYQ